MVKSLTIAAAIVLLPVGAAAQDDKENRDPRAGDTLAISVYQASVFKDPSPFARTIFAKLRYSAIVEAAGGPKGQFLPVRLETLDTLNKGASVAAVEGEAPKPVVEWTGTAKPPAGTVGYVLRSAIKPVETFTLERTREKTEGTALAQHGVARGFNEDIEKEYKAKNNLGAQFATLDKAEKTPAWKTDSVAMQSKLESFRKDGRLGEFKSP